MFSHQLFPHDRWYFEQAMRHEATRTVAPQNGPEDLKKERSMKGDDVVACQLDDIHRFWFGTDTSPDEIEPQRIEFWMCQNDETDRQVRERYGHLLEPAAAIDWQPETLSREQAVALVVLFDQFPRNMFRTIGEAFAYDHLARDLARRITAGGWDRFTASERFMLGLPFAHHENEADQDYAVLLAAVEALKAPASMKEAARFNMDQATRHRDVIRRFGRFPHRNAMVGRESTPEEVEFLATALRGRGF